MEEKAMTSETKLSVENVDFGYRKGKMLLFDNLSLTLMHGGIYGLIGLNGAGKSSLIYLMSGLLTPQNGDVILDGVNVRRREPGTLSEIYVVPEEYDLPNMTISRYVAVNAPFYPRFSSTDMEQYLHLFDMDGFIGTGPRSKTKMHELSMGQKKKIFMSFALATHASVILMDEPTNGLDIPGKSQFRKIIAAGAGDNQIILISTHQVHDVEALLDHVIMIHDSKILLNASMTEISSALSFVESDDKSVQKMSIASIPTHRGSLYLLPNTTGDETEVDLELLFYGVLNNPDAIASLFIKNQPSNN
jgi:ABC-2 type transport system ATP-binding protein